MDGKDGKGAKRAGRGRQSHNAKLMAATVVAAIFAIAVSLFYLSRQPEPMHLGTILATIFGVGGTVLIAGALMTLIYHSSRSGYDDHVGR